MKIKTVFPDDKNLAKVQARFYEVADARGVPREEAVMQAMLLWIGTEEITLVSDQEWTELAPELQRIRARIQAERTESIDKEPDL